MQGRVEKKKYWYRISVDSLKLVLVLSAITVAVVVGIFGYQVWQQDFERREAARNLEESRSLAQRLEGEVELRSFRREYNQALKSYRKGRAEYESERFAEAVQSSTQSRNMLQMIHDALHGGGSLGDARIFMVKGSVSFRRGEAGSWEAARGRIYLAEGDFVRTDAGGSAAIMLADGTLSTIRPDTLVKIGGVSTTSAGATEQSMEMEYGWVNLNTRDQESNVTTPEAEARVSRRSQASVSYDRSSGTGRFVSYKGGLRVASKDGSQQREIADLKQVVQRGNSLSQPTSLPAEPHLLEPLDNHQTSFGGDERLSLSWQPVTGARSYALQISQSSLFVDNIIDHRDRSRPGATLGIQGEGTFLWRVAAIGRNGVQGPWSAPRKFRVTSLVGTAERDNIPPQLELLDIKPYGNIFIVSGKTEPGAVVEINDELVTVSSDGAFTKSVQFADAGYKLLIVRSKDAWGNETEERKQVFVEAF